MLLALPTVKILALTHPTPLATFARFSVMPATSVLAPIPYQPSPLSDRMEICARSGHVTTAISMHPTCMTKPVLSADASGHERTATMVQCAPLILATPPLAPVSTLPSAVTTLTIALSTLAMPSLVASTLLSTHLFATATIDASAI